MPASTTNLKIPYPVAADKVSAFPALAKQAADQIDAALVAASGGQVVSNIKEKNIGAPKGANIPSNTVTMTTTGGVVVIVAQGQFKVDGPASGFLRALVDGKVNAAPDVRIYSDRAAYIPTWQTILILPNIPAGQHTFAYQVSVDSGSTNAVYINGSRIQVFEIR